VGGRAGHAGVRYRSRAAAEKEIHFSNPSASAAPAPSSRPFLSLPLGWKSDKYEAIKTPGSFIELAVARLLGF
jgi:hypothetical protein